VDRSTVRKYVAPALAAGMRPGGEPISPGRWAQLLREWFPELTSTELRHRYGLFPNPVIAEGVLDRLVNCAHHVLMEGRSYRPNRRPGARPAPVLAEEEMP